MNTETLLLLLRLLSGTGSVYLLYRLLLKKRVGGNTSRFFLLAGTVLFSVLPFLPAAGISNDSTYLIRLPEIAVTPTTTETAGSFTVSWTTLLYFSMAGLAGLLFSVKLVTLFLLKRRGHSYTENGIPVTAHTDIRFPFSFGKRVYLPPGMDAPTRKLVLAHETVHIRQLHTLDVLFFECLKIMGWFNPFYYLLEKELRQTHEFTADAVMLQNGVSASRYCEALLSCALAGMRVPVNYFHGSQIKTRIYMMNKPKNRRKGAVLFAAAVLALGSMALTTPRLLGQTVPSKEVFSTVEEMPEFPGGNEAMTAYMVKNVHYPEQAIKNKTEGRVMVGFVVDHTGRVTDVKTERSLSAETDAEAVRVIKGMPAWKPGKQNGRPVNVKLVLPVAFKLQ